jgi:acyl-CoA thioesterase II
MSRPRSTILPYLARAVVGDMVIAASRRAVRVDHDDALPELWFPRSDLTDPARAEGLGHAGSGELVNHVSFDHEQVQLEIVDGVDGEDERDVTVKRFPHWGDAADLIELIDVTEEEDHRYVSAARGDWRRPVVEGSQILGQSIVAASRSAPGRRAVSQSMVFCRAVDAQAPHTIALDQVSGGRTFTALRAEAVQRDRVCAVGTVLLDVTAPGGISHAEPPPAVPGPYDSTPYDMGVTGRDLRIVDDAYTGDPDAPVGPPELDAWVRFRDVPDDPALHAGLLAQFTGHLSIAAALRPHAGIGQDQAHRTLSTAINAISLSIHGDARADRWMLYHHRSTSAADGMTHAACRVYDDAGALVASFTVDAMVRPFADPSIGADHRRTL